LFDGEPTLEELAEPRSVHEGRAGECLLILALGGIAGLLNDAVADRNPALSPKPADPDRGEGMAFQLRHRGPLFERGKELAFGQTFAGIAVSLLREGV
jgi:hypothetical protein